jgi:pimeloyl-ACP methyl ester carboxylesterase
MDLFFREFGSGGDAVIVVHGLYGCSDNWVSIARAISAEYHVFALDLRNHGRSPHSDEHSYDAMCNDLAEFIISKKIYRPVVVGHSMGGRCVALLAKRYPLLVSKIIIVDISPFDCEYQDKILTSHKNILDALSAVDTTKIRSRADAAAQISGKIKDVRLQNFLLKNLYKSPNGSFLWRFNRSSILKNVNNIMCGSLKKCDDCKIQIPTLLIKGEKSNHVSTFDIQIIKSVFENLKTIEIANAGHWLHAEKQAEFIECVQKFICADK